MSVSENDALFKTIDENSFKSANTKYYVQWNLVIKRSKITKPSYNKVVLLVPALYIFVLFSLNLILTR